MSIEDKFDKFANESSQFHGEVRQFMSNTMAYIGAVSENVKDTKKDLKEHIEDNNAHALGVREKGGDKWLSMVALGVAAIAAVGEFFRK